MCAGYADVLVMRNPREGAARAASLYSDVPVINAGDGGHLHPTQTLTDLTTITCLRGGVDGMRVGLCGDLKNGRTVHSLIMALARFEGIVFYLISPRELAIPDYLRRFMQEKKLRYYESSALEAAIPQLDVLYMTRIQRERFTDPLEYDRLKGVYILNRSKLKNAKKDLLIMHPLPRVDEIAQDVDSDPRAAYLPRRAAACHPHGAFIKLSHMERIKRSRRGRILAGCVQRTLRHRLRGLSPALKKDGCCAYCDRD
jgi:aspartate carbamoyltransferase catalytic subunit